MNEVLEMIEECLEQNVSVSNIMKLMINVMLITDHRASDYLKILNRWGIIDCPSLTEKDLHGYLKLVCGKAMAGATFLTVAECISQSKNVDLKTAKLLLRVLVWFEIVKFEKYDKDRKMNSKIASIQGIPTDKEMRQIFDDVKKRIKFMSSSERKFIEGIKSYIPPLQEIIVDKGADVNNKLKFNPQIAKKF